MHIGDSIHAFALHSGMIFSQFAQWLHQLESLVNPQESLVNPQTLLHTAESLVNPQ